MYLEFSLNSSAFIQSTVVGAAKEIERNIAIGFYFNLHD